MNLFRHGSAWLQQNHDLALLGTMTLGCLGLTAFPESNFRYVLLALIAFISGGVLIIKINRWASLRVPATEKAWLVVLTVSMGSLLFSLAQSEALDFGLTLTCLVALYASLRDRQVRYQMARARVQRRRSKQSDWRKAKKQVLSEWKDRLRWMAGVQHDMRQPLHALGLLISHPDLNQTPSAFAVIQRINSCHRWLQELAENTLEATRLELNEPRQAEIRSIASTQVCSGLQTWIGHLASAKGLDFKVEVEEQMIHTDSRRLKRVLGNLLFNAVEHSFEGEVSLSYSRQGGIHQFVINDNGPGLAENVLGSAEAPSAFGSDLPKTGIGLYVVRKLCAEMNWNLSFHNGNDYTGTTFVLELADQIGHESLPSEEDPSKRKDVRYKK